jgi:LmbE family N-acetylglucosaminyl deacetylase
MQRNLTVPDRALAIGAHPDDIEFQCGGTLAKWAAAGCEVHLLVCTDGSKGSWDPDADPPALTAVRAREAREAADALGASGEVVTLGWVDGEVQATSEAVEQVAIEIRRLRPDVVLSHDPWKRYRLHPDHRNVGWIVLDAVVASREPHFFADHPLEHHRPSRLLLFEADEADHVEDVGDHIDTKVAALLCHRSQFQTTMEITDPDDPAQVAAFRHRLLDRMEAEGRPLGVRDCETFKQMET